ncbi:MAG: N-acetylglucosamine-6-sulfatase [Pseudonocardiales bacterium]|nr:N-acetylglucosamine-6-sulfatase [Pseudonocardiales bacterium]
MRTRSARRRGLACVLAALALPMALTACVGNAAPPVPKPLPTDGRPNIVFILTDDLSVNLLPYLPHVQALAQAGMSFENYYVVDSLCCPSRAAIFTGQYPHDDGVFSNHGADGGYSAYNANHNQEKSFGVALHRAGYFTGFMGKYLNGYQPSDPPAPGWDDWNVAGMAYSEYGYELNENGSLHFYGHTPDDYLTRVLAQKAVGFVYHAQYTGKPFALEVATFAPHRPATPAPVDQNSFPSLTAPQPPSFGVQPVDPPAWLADLPPLSSGDVKNINHEFRLRVESVQAVDRLIGQVERALAETHQLDNTYLVFSSDNGYHMGEHSLMPGKQTAFTTDIRVPLVVAGPDVPAGRTVDAMTSSIDLAPTFLQLADAQPTGVQDGVSLLDLWHGRTAPSDWQRAVLIEHHGPVDAANDPDVQPNRSGNPPSYEAMRTATSLYVEYDTGEFEYYDLATDPAELYNRYGSLSPQRRAELHGLLHRLQTCHGAVECQRAAAPASV